MDKEPYRTLGFLLVIVLLMVSARVVTPTRALSDDTQAHKDVLRRLVTEVFNKGNFAILDEVYAPDYVQTDPAGRKVDLKTYKDSLMRQREAVPDAQGAIIQLVAEGDWVAGRYYYGGTFTKEFVAGTGQKIPPTGKPIMFTTHVLSRFNDKDQIVEEILTRDDLGVYMQLGVIPMPKDAPAMMPPDIKSMKEIMSKTVSADVMTQEKKVPGRVADEAFGQGKFDVLDQAFPKDYKEYDNENPPIGLDAFKAQTMALRAAMPDLKATADHIVVEGDWSAFVFTYGGTFKNELASPDGQKVPPTGKPLQQMGIIFAHYNDQGQNTESYYRADNFSFLIQAGILKP